MHLTLANVLLRLAPFQPDHDTISQSKSKTPVCIVEYSTNLDLHSKTHTNTPSTKHLVLKWPQSWLVNVTTTGVSNISVLKRTKNIQVLVQCTIVYLAFGKHSCCLMLIFAILKHCSTYHIRLQYHIQLQSEEIHKKWKGLFTDMR